MVNSKKNVVFEILRRKTTAKIYKAKLYNTEKKRCAGPGERLEWEKAYSTQCSQVVAHLSTNWA